MRMHFQETLEILSLRLPCALARSRDRGQPCAQHSTRSQSLKLSSPVTLHPPVAARGRGCTPASCEVQAQHQAGRNPAGMLRRTLRKHKEQMLPGKLGAVAWRWWWWWPMPPTHPACPAAAPASTTLWPVLILRLVRRQILSGLPLKHIRNDAQA